MEDLATVDIAVVLAVGEGIIDFDDFDMSRQPNKSPDCVKTGSVLDLVFGSQTDILCTDGWGAYERHLPAQCHERGKRKTQRIERKHLRLTTRIKRLARQTICFDKTEEMHDLVIGLFINRYEFSLPI